MKHFTTIFVSLFSDFNWVGLIILFVFLIARNLNKTVIMEGKHSMWEHSTIISLLDFSRSCHKNTNQDLRCVCITNIKARSSSFKNIVHICLSCRATQLVKRRFTLNHAIEGDFEGPSLKRIHGQVIMSFEVAINFNAFQKCLL
jgi:hypothetical protein